MKFKSKNQKMGWIFFGLYLVCLIYLVFFAESFGRSDRSRSGYSYNLEPFKEIRRFWIYRERLGWRTVIINLLGNVVWFMPFGFFLPVISRRGELWYNTVLLGFCFSLCIETVQLIFKVGSFDVDDMILNTLGAVLGYVTYAMVQRIRRRRRNGASG